VRPLGIPTVGDRIAQMVVKRYLEPELEKQFHPDSYPNFAKFLIKRAGFHYFYSF